MPIKQQIVNEYIVGKQKTQKLFACISVVTKRNIRAAPASSLGTARAKNFQYQRDQSQRHASAAALSKSPCAWITVTKPKLLGDGCAIGAILGLANWETTSQDYNKQFAT